MTDSRLSQLPVEALVEPQPDSQISQYITEVLTKNLPPTSALSQLPTEVLTRSLPALSATSQVIVEVLTIESAGVPTEPVYVNITFIWDVELLSVTSDLDLQWEVKGPLYTELDLRWDVHQLETIYANLTLRWDVTRSFNKNLTLQWQVRRAYARFRPPHGVGALYRGHRFMDLLGYVVQGITLWRDPDGNYHEMFDGEPFHPEFANRTEYWQGGRVYQLTEQQHTDLTIAGYGEWIEIVDEDELG